MNNERRKYPKVSLNGDVAILLAGVIRSGALMQVSPAGIQIECRHQLIEQLAKFKSDAGLYPNFELEFALPICGTAKTTIKSICNVAYCRRQCQDRYHLGLNFVTLDENDEKQVDAYIDHAYAA